MAPVADDTSDLSYQTCYVFSPTNHAHHDIDTRPRKKRKTIDAVVEPSTEGLQWPKLSKGDETDRLVHRRELTYQRHWRDAHQRMEAVAAVNIDEPTVERIRAYIGSKQESKSELRAAIIVSGADKSAFGNCLGRIQEAAEETLVVKLQASQSPSLQAGLKAIIRNTIEIHSSARTYDNFVAKHKRQIPMNFDLELLHKYVEATSINKIVVAMPDAETFDLNVFSELVANLLSWKDRLPFVLALGLATTVHLFESRLSKATMRRLNAEVFALSSQRDVFFDLLEAVQTRSGHEDDPESTVLLGPALISTLASLAEEQTMTIQSFKKAIQYAFMTHFFSNLLSAVLDVDMLDSDDVDTSLCEAIRATPSFQAYCTTILDGKVVDTEAPGVRALLSSDTALLEYTQQQLSHTYTSLSMANTSCLLVARLATELSPKTAPIKLYHDLLTSHARSNIFDSDAYSIIESTLPALTTTAFATFITKLPTASIPTSATGSPSALQAHITSLLDTLPTLPYQPLFPSEAILITSRSPLVSAFNPKPRFAIERALSTPSDYLGCECCVSSMHSIEPTIVLYRLLGEAGREVNVMDLWTTFWGRVMGDETTSTTKAANGKGKGKDHKTPKGKEKHGAKTNAPPAKNKRKSRAAENDDDQDTEMADSNGHVEEEGEEDAASAAEQPLDPERRVLAQFYSALAELRYLGLVKSASDRRLNKGVEVVSRVTWHGL